MVVPAKKDAVLQAGLAALGLVLDVVHFTRRSGLVTASCPSAVLIPKDDGVADPGRDGLGVLDIQRKPGPPSRAPSCRRRKNEARPPGPDRRSTAWPMICCSSASRIRRV